MNGFTLALVVWLAQVTLLLGVALLAARVLRRRAALAHGVLVAAVVAALLLPVLTWASERTGWSLLPSGWWPAQAAIPASAPNGALPNDLIGPRAFDGRLRDGPGTPALAPPGERRDIEALGLAGDAVTPTHAASSVVAPPASLVGERFERLAAALGMAGAGPIASLAIVLALGAWSIASIWMIGRLGHSIVRVRALRRDGEPCDEPAIAAALDGARRELGIARRIELRRSHGVRAPLISAWCNPIVVVPAASPAAVDWNAVMRHELAHLRRRDHVSALLAELLVAVLPWHPLSRLVRRRMATLAEWACDDAAIDARSERVTRGYARSLLAFVPVSGVPRWTPAVVGEDGVGARVERLLGRRGVAPRGSRAVAALLALSTVAVTAAAAVTGARGTGVSPEPPIQGDRSDPPAREPGARAPADAGGDFDLDAALEEIRSIVLSPKRPLDRSRLWDLARRVDELKDPRSIAPLIALIAADEQYDTVYGLGYFGLSRTTGVRYSPFHDGPWWSRWWRDHRASLGEPFATMEIPRVPLLPSALAHRPYPEDLDTPAGKRRWLEQEFRSGRTANLALSSIAQELAEAKDLASIPLMIGIIDADNGYDTVYGVGYFGLGRLTGVDYSPFHDGPWWRRWWERHRSQFPDAIAELPIPAFDKTRTGLAVTPMPESFDSLDGKIAWFREALRTNATIPIDDFAEALAEHRDPRAIPFLIALLGADDRTDAAQRLGHRALHTATGVALDPSHDAAWWRAWYAEHRTRLGLAGREHDLPDLRSAMSRWRAGEGSRAAAELDRQFPTVPRSDRRAGGDEMMRYLQFGPGESAPAPKNGWGVLLILPGGDGSADFESFCRSIAAKSMPDGFVAAELVAPSWSESDHRVVWPTARLNPDSARFTTEQFIDAVIEDLAQRMPIDRSRILALGWSSSGPALYADLLRPDSPVTGRVIAMSVFRPLWFGDGPSLADRRVFLLHSPDDRMIPMDAHARRAESRLRELGATVLLESYAGGHGWTEDPHAHIEAALRWLLAPT